MNDTLNTYTYRNPSTSIVAFTALQRAVKKLQRYGSIAHRLSFASCWPDTTTENTFYSYASIVYRPELLTINHRVQTNDSGRRSVSKKIYIISDTMLHNEYIITILYAFETATTCVWYYYYSHTRRRWNVSGYTEKVWKNLIFLSLSHNIIPLKILRLITEFNINYKTIIFFFYYNKIRRS